MFEHDTALTAAKRDSLIRNAAMQLDTIARKNAWMGFFLSYAPDSTARKVKVPTLILHGATDRQVTQDQAGKLAAAIRAGGNRDVTVKVFPDRNHLFLSDPDGNPQRYSRLRTNRIDAEVLGTIVDWLVARLGVN
jgi:dipeptidyl aminopeptidase/acylaminoacyl peptidase